MAGSLPGPCTPGPPRGGQAASVSAEQAALPNRGVSLGTEAGWPCVSDGLAKDGFGGGGAGKREDWQENESTGD